MPRTYLRTKKQHLRLLPTGPNITRCFLQDLLDGTIQAVSSKFIRDSQDNLLFIEYTEPHMLDTTGLTDSTETLQAFLNPTRPNSVVFGSSKPRLTIDMPYGAEILTTEPIHIYEPIHLNMNGSRIFQKTATGLSDILVVHDTAARTRISNGELIHAVPGVSLQDSDKTGLKVECHQFRLDHMRIYGTGWGIVMDSEAETYNLNGAQFYDVEITSFRRDGIWVKGVDASAHIFVGVTFFVGQNHFNHLNGHGPSYGLRDECANGIFSFGTRFEMTGAPDKSRAMYHNPPGGQAPSTHVAAYIEAGDQLDFGASSNNIMAIGGHLGLREDWEKDKVGAKSSKLTFRKSDDSGRSWSITIPDQEQNAIMSWRTNDNADDQWMLIKDVGAAAGTSRWTIKHYYNQATPILGFEAVKTGEVWTVDSIVLE